MSFITLIINTQNQYEPSVQCTGKFLITHAGCLWYKFLIICLGCGSGNYTVALSEYVGKVTGLEMNEGMLGRAMEKTATLKNVSLTQGDITKMPFPDNQFDGICYNQVYYS